MGIMDFENGLLAAKQIVKLCPEKEKEKHNLGAFSPRIQSISCSCIAKLRFWVNDNLICILRKIKDILLKYKIIHFIVFLEGTVTNLAI